MRITLKFQIQQRFLLKRQLVLMSTFTALANFLPIGQQIQVQSIHLFK